MKARKLFSFMMSVLLVGLLIQPALAAESEPEGLVIESGNCGTLLASDEHIPSIALHNPTDHEIVVNTFYLGEYSSVSVAPGDNCCVTVSSAYDENGDAYKLALLGTDGVTTAEYPIVPGTELDPNLSYTVSVVRGVGDVYESHGQETPRWITCMVYADENGIVPERSVLAGVDKAVQAGATQLTDISFCSYNDNTAAIRVGGSGTLTVRNADIQLYGDGGDDFTGIGAALGVADSGTLTVSNTNVYTEGILRSAIFAGDEGFMNLYNVTVDCEPGEYQADVNIPSAGMASPPNGLGIWGNCRAMNLVDGATVNISNSEITSQDWGALGVDDVTNGHLTVQNSTIRIKDQGYGAYAIGRCVDVFENCVFDIEYGVVGFAAAGDGSEMILSGGSQADSRNYYGFLTHQSFNGLNSKITVTGEGTALRTKLGGIIAKGRGTDIEISHGAVVTAESGVLVRAQINDDTGAGSMDGSEVVNITVRDTSLVGDIIQGMGAEYQGTDSSGAMEEAAPFEMEESALDMAAPPEGGMGPGGPGGPGGSGGPGGGTATTESTMNVTLDQAELTGAISSATLVPVIEDGNISMDNIRDVGVIQETTLEYNSYAKLNVTLENSSRWVVTETSYLMSLTIDDSSTLDTAPGYKLVMTVNGVETPIEPGTYNGEIQIDVLEDTSYVAEESEGAESSTTETTPEEPTPNPEPSPAPTVEAAPEVTKAPAESSSGIGTAGIIGIILGAAVVIGVIAGIIFKRKQL